MAQKKIWLRTMFAMNLCRSKRLALIERDARPLTLRAQYDLLGLNRTGSYYQPQPQSPEEVAFKNRIDELYTASPFYGSHRIAKAFCPRFVVNR